MTTMEDYGGDWYNTSNPDDSGEPCHRCTFGQQTVAAIWIFTWFLFAASLGRNGVLLWAMGVFGT